MFLARTVSIGRVSISMQKYNKEILFIPILMEFMTHFTKVNTVDKVNR